MELRVRRGGVPDFEVLHAIFAGHAGGLGLGDAAFVGGVEVDLIADENLDGDLGFLVFGDPVLDLFEGLALGN